MADPAVVGDDAPIALAQRPAFVALGEGRRSARIRAAAELVTGVHVRTAAVAKLLRQAAPEVFLLLVEESGWTPEQYEAWMDRRSARGRDPTFLT